MKRILMLCSLAAAVGVALPALATAQDTASRGGEVARAPSYASLMSALAATERATEKIKGMTTINEADVRVVDVGTLVTNENQMEFSQAIDRHKAELDSLHAAIQANPTLANAIARHTGGGVMTDTAQTGQAMVTVQDVVAADVIDDKEVVLYVRRKQ